MSLELRLLHNLKEERGQKTKCNNDHNNKHNPGQLYTCKTPQVKGKKCIATKKTFELMQKKRVSAAARSSKQQQRK